MTLVVYIYQARIMQKQQYASVWPYIEWDMTISSDEGIYLSVINKGVGPAIIRSTNLTLDEQPLTHTNEYFEKLLSNPDTFAISYAEVDNRVLAPGEELRLFHLKDGAVAMQLYSDSIYTRTGYSICFCSVYDDCWVSKGLIVEPAKCN
jgi:hypothetical protein